ncbi:MAG: hypothetical protein NTY09_01810 [bacterium]|nr:hypothetical protein [bacterium]
MKILNVLIVSLFVFLLATPVYADTATTYIENEIAEWTEIANNDGFKILETYSGEIGTEYLTYELELAPGVYHFYASGGENVTDLDMYLYGQDGIPINSDTLPDKIPIVVIKLDEPATVSVELTAYSFTPGSTKGLFCVLVTCENEGEVLSMSGGAASI